MHAYISYVRSISCCTRLHARIEGLRFPDTLTTQRLSTFLHREPRTAHRVPRFQRASTSSVLRPAYLASVPASVCVAHWVLTYSTRQQRGSDLDLLLLHDTYDNEHRYLCETRDADNRFLC